MSEATVSSLDLHVVTPGLEYVYCYTPTIWEPPPKAAAERYLVFAFAMAVLVWYCEMIKFEALHLLHKKSQGANSKILHT